MSTFQTLLALVVLIFVLSVIVQAVQEVVKSLLDTKAKEMEKIITKFMGNHLSLAEVKGALQVRGLVISDLDQFSKEDFRHLLDGINPSGLQVASLVTTAGAGIEEAKNNIAGSYEAARAAFQKAYASKNKMFVMVISFVVVLGLNASLIKIYEILSADQNLSQMIAGTGSKIMDANKPAQAGGSSDQSTDLAEVYKTSRKTVNDDLKNYPILLRTGKYSEDLQQEAFHEVVGLFLMGLLVSLGAPFWNDVLKGMMGVNNALNSGGKKTS